MVVTNEYSFLETVIFSIGTGLGFTLAMVIMAGIREELEFADIPVSLRGTSLTLLIAGIMSMAFMGFAGLVPM